MICIWLGENRETQKRKESLRGFSPFCLLHMHNYLRLQIAKKIYNGALVTLKGKRNTFIWIFKTVANMQIFRGLFHVKVNLRVSDGKRRKKCETAVVELAEREENKDRMNCVEIECYETYNLSSLLLKRSCRSWCNCDCRYMTTQTKAAAFPRMRLRLFKFYFYSIRTLFIVFKSNA